MIIITAVRVSIKSVVGNSIDIQWGDFWAQVEGSVAIIVVSITAFRSLLGMKAGERRQKRFTPDEHRKRFLPWKASSSSSKESDVKPASLPAIPGATLTGMRTFIDGSGNSRNELEEEAAAVRKAIKVTHYLSTHSEHQVCGIIYLLLPR